MDCFDQLVGTPNRGASSLLTAAANSPGQTQVLSSNSFTLDSPQSWQLAVSKRDVDLMDTSEFLER